MNDFEKLLSEISLEIPVIEIPLKDRGFSGLYRNGRIYLDPTLPTNEKKEVLMEEYCHHLTSAGNILDYDHPESRKQENRARRLSIEELVSLDSILDCFKSGIESKSEVADYFDLSEEFIQDVITHYYQKYGHSIFYKRHIIVFDDESIRVIPTRFK